MQYLSTAEIATLHTEFAKSVYTNLTDAQRFAYVAAPEGTVPNPITVAPTITAVRCSLTWRRQSVSAWNFARRSSTDTARSCRVRSIEPRISSGLRVGIT